MSNILVTGSLAYDYVMLFDDHFANHILPDKLEILNVSFTASKMSKNYGGTAGNIAYGLSLLQEPHVLFGTVGEDFGIYKNWLEKNEIDTSHVHVIPNEFTAAAHIITDNKQNQITAFYGGAMLKNDIPVSPILESKAIKYGIISADGRDGMLLHAKELKDKGICCIYDPGHSLPAFGGEDLKTLITGSYIVIVNEYEEHLLVEKTGLSREEICQLTDYFIVTKGVQGSEIYTKDKSNHVAVAKAHQVIDPTGAGDAYRSGLLKGLSLGLSVEDSCQVASMAACYAVEAQGTQSYNYSKTNFLERIKENYGEQEFHANIFA